MTFEFLIQKRLSGHDFELVDLLQNQDSITQWTFQEVTLLCLEGGRKHQVLEKSMNLEMANVNIS